MEKSIINLGISYIICKVIDFFETLNTHVPVYFIPDKPFEILQSRVRVHISCVIPDLFSVLNKYQQTCTQGFSMGGICL